MAKTNGKGHHPLQTSLFQPKQLFDYSELEQMHMQVLACQKCPLFQTRQQAVFSEGNHKQPDIFFLGEAPGENEEKLGRPFVGKAGTVFDTLLAKSGIHRHLCYIANTVCCRPPNNRKPTVEEMMSCSSYLRAQIRSVQPRVIVCLGATAAEALLGKKMAVGSMRNRWYSYHDIPVRVTYHPAYLLRNAKDEDMVLEDIRQVRIKIAELSHQNETYDDE